MRRNNWLPFIISLSILVGFAAFGAYIYIGKTHEGPAALLEQIAMEKDLKPSVVTTKKLPESTTVREYTEENEEVVPVNATDIVRINPSTRIVFQDYYMLDDTIEISEGEPAYNIVNMTREDLMNYYQDWQILSFGSEKVVLRRMLNKRNPKGYYMVKEKDGEIAVYYDYTNDLRNEFNEQFKTYEYSEEDYTQFEKQFLTDNAEHYLRETIDLPVTVLPEEEVKRLSEGILIYSEEELIKLLENYTS